MSKDTRTIYERLKAIQGDDPTYQVAQPSTAPAPVAPTAQSIDRDAWGLAFRLYSRYIPGILAAAHDEATEKAAQIFQDAARELEPLYSEGITGRRLAVCVLDCLSDHFEAEKIS